MRELACSGSSSALLAGACALASLLAVTGRGDGPVPEHAVVECQRLLEEERARLLELESRVLEYEQRVRRLSEQCECPEESEEGTATLLAASDWGATHLEPLEQHPKDAYEGTTANPATEGESSPDSGTMAQNTISEQGAVELAPEHQSPRDLGTVATQTSKQASLSCPQSHPACLSNGSCAVESCRSGCSVWTSGSYIDGYDGQGTSCAGDYAETICSDSPSTWVDSFGEGCLAYANRSLCTASGGYGTGWNSDRGSFEDWAVDGVSADEACCVCGGGVDTRVEACDAVDGRAFSSTYPCRCGSTTCVNNHVCNISSGHCVMSDRLTIAWPCVTSGGVFSFSRTTRSGAPIYEDGAGHYIYHDPNCDGDIHGTAARWVLDHQSPSLTALQDLDGDGACGYIARVHSNDLNGPPSGEAVWRVECDGSFQYRRVAIHWQPEACDVSDASGPSSVYPCACGNARCVSSEVCASASSRCGDWRFPSGPASDLIACQAGPLFEDQPVVVICENVTKVEDEAFRHFDSLVEVHIPDSVTEIGERAFEGCRSLMKVHIPDSVVTVGPESFQGCTSLVELRIGKSVSKISWSAFRQCPSLVDAQIPDSVVAISDWAFAHCSSLRRVTLGGSLALVESNAFLGCCQISVVVSRGAGLARVFDRCARVANVTIAGKRGGKWMLSGNCDHLTTLTILSPLVASEAWMNCPALLQLHLGEGLHTIGYSAFRNCSQLVSVSALVSVTTLGNEVFKDCAALTHMTIGDQIVTLGNDAFDGCDSLVSVVIPSQFPGDFGDAFDCEEASLASVAFLSSSVEVDEELLEDCTSVVVVQLPESIVLIDDAAFAGCSSLSSITFGSNLHAINEEAFSGCSSLSSAPLSDAVDWIGPYAFADCSSLQNLTIPPEITEISEGAFSGCESLEWLVVAGSVSLIEPHAFADCSALAVAVVGDSVTEIAGHAFSGCSSLSSITLGSELTSIGRSTFFGCSSLRSLPLGDEIVEIWDSAFEDCASLQDVTIPPEIESIEERTFAGCASLTHINISGIVSEIEEGAFHSCTNLATVIIGDSVLSIGDHAFDGCTALSVVEMSHRTLTIGDSAFRHCASLSRVMLPSSVSMVGRHAFYNTSIAQAMIMPPLPELGWRAFPAFTIISQCSEPFLPVIRDLNIECECPSGFRFEHNSGDCVPCERYLSCPGGHSPMDGEIDATVSVQEGYMTLASSPFDVYACVSTARCPGERLVLSDLMCASHFDATVPSCALCQPDTFETASDRCESCEDWHDPTLYLKFALLCTISLGTTFKLYRDNDLPSTSVQGMLSAGVSFLQALQTLIRLDLQRTPAVLVVAYKILESPSFSNLLQLVGYRPECIIGTGYSTTIWQHALSPLTLFVNIAVLRVLFKIVRRRMSFNVVHSVVGLVFTGLFLTLTRMSFSLFYTVRMPNGKLMVRGFPDLEYASDRWLQSLPVNLLATMLWGVTTLSYTAHAVWTAPRRMASEPGFAVRFGFCFSSVRPDRWWWILMQLAYSMALNMVYVIFENVYAQVYSSLFLSFVFSMFLFRAWPSLFLNANLVDLFNRVAVIIFLIFATSFVDTDGISKDAIEEMNLGGAYVVIVAVVSATCFMLLLLASALLTPMQLLSRKRVSESQIIWQFRDVALAVLMLPDDEFASRLSSIGDAEHDVLSSTTERLINIVFGKQYSRRWTDQRLIEGDAAGGAGDGTIQSATTRQASNATISSRCGDSEVWDHHEAVVGIMREAVSGRAMATLEQSMRLRRKVVKLAEAIYEEAGIHVHDPWYSGLPHERILRMSTRAWASELGSMRAIMQTVSRLSGSGYLTSASGSLSTRLRTSARSVMLGGGTSADSLTRARFRRMVASLQDLEMSEADGDSIFDVLDSTRTGEVSLESFTCFLTALAPPGVVSALGVHMIRPTATMVLASCSPGDALGGLRALHTDEAATPSEAQQGHLGYDSEGAFGYDSGGNESYPATSDSERNPDPVTLDV